MKPRSVQAQGPPGNGEPRARLSCDVTDVPVSLLGPAVDSPAGTVLFRQGAPVERLFFIERGMAKIVRSELDRDLILAIRGPGWLLGTASTILLRPHLATGITVAPSVVRALQARTLLNALSRNEIANWLLRRLARESFEQTCELGALGSLDAAARFERLFLRFVRQAGEPLPDGSIRVRIALRRHELAQAIATTPEQCSRILSRFVSQGCLARNRAGYVVPLDSRWHVAQRVWVDESEEAT